MKNFCGALLIGFVIFGVKAQDIPLPSDFRQQNLTEYNSSLLNPAYSLDRNNPSSVALWTRWQWQTFDGDPTSLFLNYTARINNESAVGVAFFQNNTGIFLNTGVALNYAYKFQLSDKASLGLGLNFFGYQQKLADDRFFIPNPIQTTITNDFIIQLAPGLNFNYDGFSIGIVSENLFDYNLSTNERNSDPEDRMFFAMASYDIPMQIINNDDNSMLRPSIYYKNVPGLDSQFGINSLLTTNKFWAQAGYNSFYGISGGIGGRFFKRFSIGALIEVGTSSELKGTDPSFEFVTSYKLGPLAAPEEEIEKTQEVIADEKNKKDVLLQKELSKAEELALKKQRREDERQEKLKAKELKDSLERAERQTLLALKESERAQKRANDSIVKVSKETALAAERVLNQKREQDSLNALRVEEELVLAAAQQRKQDSILASENAAAELQKEQEAIAMKKEVVQPEEGEKYEEVVKQGSLEPGYYLIANVFGTKKYFEAFMVDMRKNGLQPGSFYRDINKYNYVYLGKYNRIDDARKARDSKLGGTYNGKLWIFRVLGE